MEPYQCIILGSFIIGLGYFGISKYLAVQTITSVATETRASSDLAELVAATGVVGAVAANNISQTIVIAEHANIKLIKVSLLILTKAVIHAMNAAGLAVPELLTGLVLAKTMAKSILETFEDQTLNTFVQNQTRHNFLEKATD